MTNHPESCHQFYLEQFNHLKNGWAENRLLVAEDNLPHHNIKKFQRYLRKLRENELIVAEGEISELKVNIRNQTIGNNSCRCKFTVKCSASLSLFFFFCSALGWLLVIFGSPNLHGPGWPGKIMGVTYAVLSLLFGTVAYKKKLDLKRLEKKIVAQRKLTKF